MLKFFTMWKIISFFIFYLSILLYPESLQVYFTPHQEVDNFILEKVEEANKCVYIASYSFGWRKLLGKLLELKKKNVDVKIFIEKSFYQDGLEKNIRKDNLKNSLFHPKFMIIDEEKLLIGSLNFTYENIYLHHNNIIFIENKELTGYFYKTFLSFWNGKRVEDYYKKGKFEVYFSPWSDCENILRKYIFSANFSIYFALFDFTSEGIARQIIEKKKKGIRVFGIIERNKILPYSVFYLLEDFGCKMKKSNMAGLLHDKFFIIDEETVITGSYNPTLSARRNIECLFIVKDKKVAKEFLKEWKNLWLWYSL